MKEEVQENDFVKVADYHLWNFDKRYIHLSSFFHCKLSLV